MALGQAYMLNCPNWHKAMSPEVANMLYAWHEDRPEQVNQASEVQDNFIKQMVATGRASNERAAWALWCTGIKPAIQSMTLKLHPGYAQWLDDNLEIPAMPAPATCIRQQEDGSWTNCNEAPASLRAPMKTMPSTCVQSDGRGGVKSC